MSDKKFKISWALTRVSSKEQGKVQHGSLEQQKNGMLRWVKEIPEQIMRCEYRLEKIIGEMKSGRKDKFHLRHEIHEVFRAIESGEIDALIVESVSRLGRWGRKNAELVELCVEHDVELWITEWNKQYNHWSKADRINFGINNLMAEEESNDTSDRVSKKQREAMVNNGKDSASLPTLGWDAHSERIGIYEPNHGELKTVIEILEKFCELKSLKLTVNYCNSKEYKTKVRWTRESIDDNGIIRPPRMVGGEPFNESRPRHLLTSPKHRGFNFFKDEGDQFLKLQGADKMVRWEYAHYRNHGPLIPPDLLKRVEQTLKLFVRNRPRSQNKFGNVYLLTGALQDSQGNPFYGTSAKSGQNLYYYNRTSVHGEKKRVKKEEIEGIAIARLKQFFAESKTLNEVFSAALNNRLIGLPLIDEELPKLQRKIKDLGKNCRKVFRFNQASRNGTFWRSRQGLRHASYGKRKGRN